MLKKEQKSLVIIEKFKFAKMEFPINLKTKVLLQAYKKIY